MFDKDARSLSPITELTTPGSLRTISLPSLESPDYSSEREDSPGESTNPHGLGRTITPHPSNHVDVSAHGPHVQAAIKLPAMSTSSNRSLRPFPSSSPAPRSLPPPPRPSPSKPITPDPSSSSTYDNNEVRKRYIQHNPPRAVETTEQVGLSGIVKIDVEQGSGLAGKGTGPDSLSRPDSKKARPGGSEGRIPAPVGPIPGDHVNLPRYLVPVLIIGSHWPRFPA